MFFISGAAAESLGLTYTPQIGSVIKGLGGLIIGSGTINFLMKDITDIKSMRALLLTNIITHLLGISANILGLFDGALTFPKVIPVQITHLFVGIGSLVYLSKLKH